MKINIDHTVEVTDEQRELIAKQLDGAGGKRRQATRDEMKQFIWTEGSNWPSALVEDEGSPAEPDADDLGLGDDDPDDIL